MHACKFLCIFSFPCCSKTLSGDLKGCILDLVASTSVTLTSRIQLVPCCQSPWIRMSPRSASWEWRVSWMIGFGCTSVALVAWAGWLGLIQHNGSLRTAEGVNALAASATNLSLISLWWQIMR
jgi:hypothetical protein